MTTDPVDWILAGAAVLAWLALTLGVVVSRLRADRRRRTAARTERGRTLVAFASQTGMAEDLARMTAQMLQDAGETARVVSFADLEASMLADAKRALFVVATTGEGDAPDSAGRFVRRSLGQSAALSNLSYGLLALGDRSYRDYCGFALVVDGWLMRAGATPLFDMIKVDDGDPDAIRAWQHQLNALTGSNAAADWTPAAFHPWRLAARTLVNPGSPGGEAWRLRLEPVGDAPSWAAGDIAEIGVAEGSRDYSIASTPSEGGIELLIRLMTRPDGTPGLASGWLTRVVEIGAEVPLRIRTNNGFHGPETKTPLILIGNGTGIAGLRAHLIERGSGAGPAWLMFGERTSAHDAFFDAELRAFEARGDLRLDRCFSRDAGDGRYVQALVAEHAADLRDWIARDATILVCGSLEGMASGVHAALETALGTETVIALSEAGRYRRDVY